MTTTTTRPCDLSYDAISEYAERIGRHYSIYDHYGRADVDSLIRQLGGRVRVSARPESLAVQGRGNFEISIPFTTSTRRDRFTKAHEVGHYFLHYLFHDSTNAELFHRGSRSRAETEANVFAASLLMPASQFRKLHASNSDPWYLAGIFDVSPKAAEVRSQALRLT